MLFRIKSALYQFEAFPVSCYSCILQSKQQLSISMKCMIVVSSSSSNAESNSQISNPIAPSCTMYIAATILNTHGVVEGEETRLSSYRLYYMSYHVYTMMMCSRHLPFKPMNQANGLCRLKHKNKKILWNKCRALKSLETNISCSTDWLKA